MGEDSIHCIVSLMMRFQIWQTDSDRQIYGHTKVLETVTQTERHRDLDVIILAPLIQGNGRWRMMVVWGFNSRDLFGMERPLKRLIVGHERGLGGHVYQFIVEKMIVANTTEHLMVSAVWETEVITPQLLSNQIPAFYNKVWYYIYISLHERMCYVSSEAFIKTKHSYYMNHRPENLIHFIEHLLELCSHFAQ